MVSSTAAFATLFFSRQAGASPAGVFANIASCKCLTVQDNGFLKTTDCTTNLQNLGNQGFNFDDQNSYLGNAAGPICVTSNAPGRHMSGYRGLRAEIGNCSSIYPYQVVRSNSKLKAGLWTHGYDLKRAEDDFVEFADEDDAEDHLFEFHCASCFGDEGWTCGGAPAPVPSPDPAPAPAPAPLGNTTTAAPTPAPAPWTPRPNPYDAYSTPAPYAAVQIKYWRRGHRGGPTDLQLCMDLPGGDTSNGKLLWMWECYGGETQQWSFQDGQLVYVPDPSKCVDLLGGDTTNGNKLGIWDCYQGDSQLWAFDMDWRSIYLASSTASGATKCISIESEQKGDPIDIWDCNQTHHAPFTGYGQSFFITSPETSLAVV